MAKQRIRRLATAADGAFEVLLDDGSERPFTTTSRVVQMALATAYGLRAEVQFETYGGDSHVIKRVEAFDVPPMGPISIGTTSRLATQRFGDPGVQLLEVFIRADPKNEVQYRVVDQAVQRICHAAALSGGRFTFDLNGMEITVASVAAEPA